MANLVLADIVLRGGTLLLRGALERTVLRNGRSGGVVADIARGRSVGQTLVGTALSRVATRSVPGAIVVGGAMLAKMLNDRRKAREGGEAPVERPVRRRRKKG